MNFNGIGSEQQESYLAVIKQNYRKNQEIHTLIVLPFMRVTKKLINRHMRLYWKKQDYIRINSIILRDNPSVTSKESAEENLVEISIASLLAGFLYTMSNQINLHLSQKSALLNGAC